MPQDCSQLPAVGQDAAGAWGWAQWIAECCDFDDFSPEAIFAPWEHAERCLPGGDAPPPPPPPPPDAPPVYMPTPSDLVCQDLAAAEGWPSPNLARYNATLDACVSKVGERSAPFPSTTGNGNGGYLAGLPPWALPAAAAAALFLLVRR